jgi:hypothetical protein
MSKSRHSMMKALDWGSWVTLSVTIVLFVLALVEKGLTHEILLEAGVFLISVKLVLSAHKTHMLIKTLSEKIDSFEYKR